MTLLSPAPGAGADEEALAFPASFAQARLWLLDRVDPGAPTYNVGLGLRLRGALDAGALEAALNGVAARHESLRTTFTEVEGEPVQVIAPALRVALETDAAADPGDDAAARAWLDAQAAAPLDLSRGPLLRARLLRRNPADHLLSLVLHHAVCDGWSVGVLLDELRALYDARRAGREGALPPVPLQYADYALWEREHLDPARVERLLAFWRGHLDGVPPALELPADHPRPAEPSGRGALHRRPFPAALAAEVRARAAAERTTPFVVLLTAVQALLARWSGQARFALGTPVSGRTRPELEGVVGFLVNTLALPADVSGDPSFRALLHRARRAALAAYDHQSLPFDQVVRAVGGGRDPGRSPLFQVMVESQGASHPPPAFDGVRAEWVEAETGTAKFDLTFSFTEGEGGIALTVEYATELYEARTVERMAAHLEVLLAAALADPDRPVSRLPLMDGAERAAVLALSRGPVRPLPAGPGLHERFERRAAAAPARTAVVCAAGGATYGELNARANRLARVLRAAGAGPGERVAVLLERGTDFVAAVLAALKTGAAYVPVDPDYPHARVRHMLADAAPRAVVTRAGLLERLAAAEVRPALAVCMDDPAAPPAAPPGTRVATAAALAGADAGDPGWTGGDAARLPAYLLYTSGSTGVPKGAVVRHDGAVNHVLAEAEALGLDAELRFLQSAPASSDISVWQMLGPLLLGGRSVVVGAEVVSDPARLLAALRDEEITLAELVPAVIRALLDHAAGLSPDARALPRLRALMATGEAVPAQLVRDWLALYPAVPVVNAYGPTEAADDVAQCTIPEPPPPGEDGVPIGRPLANVQCYVVDERMELVPAGVPGELCVGGVQVGDGYHRRPGRTAASFVPDPYGGAGAVMYRTGDRARWRADGRLEFLGRADQQVKVRGFRVEPGEVEAALREHPRVRDCAVVARGAGAAARLAAFLVFRGAPPADDGPLRAFARKRLPEHMVPAEFAALDALPLAAAGKVDRAALASGRLGTPLAAASAPPRPGLESVLAAAWREVLGVPRVGRHDSFAALGGHSLLAAAVAARVRSAAGVELPLRMLLRAPTLAALAAELAGPSPSAPRPSGAAGEGWPASAPGGTASAFGGFASAPDGFASPPDGSASGSAPAESRSAESVSTQSRSAESVSTGSRSAESVSTGSRSAESVSTESRSAESGSAPVEAGLSPRPAPAGPEGPSFIEIRSLRRAGPTLVGRETHVARPVRVPPAAALLSSSAEP